MKKPNPQCVTCKHLQSTHGHSDRMDMPCNYQGCCCTIFVSPRDDWHPNSRLKSVPAPDDGPCQKDEDRENVAKRMDYSAYGRGPADVFMDEMEKINPNARVALSAGDKKKLEAQPPSHAIGWQNLDDIATEARDAIAAIVILDIGSDEWKAACQQIVRRAMHESRRPLLEEMVDLRVKDAHPMTGKVYGNRDRAAEVCYIRLHMRGHEGAIMAGILDSHLVGATDTFERVNKYAR